MKILGLLCKSTIKTRHATLFIRIFAGIFGDNIKMDKLQLIRKPVERELEELKQMWHATMQSTDPMMNTVLEYIKRKPGKLMRPVLMLLIAKLVGKVSKATYHASLAMELLHTASLLHDDVVDESGERRGMPSVNATFNNKIAVLGGDFVLATSLMQAVKTEDMRIVGIVSSLGQLLAEGEILQLENIGNSDFSEDVYYEVVRKKTASLFAACAQAGALSAGANDDAAETARNFGELLGIAFQIKDDIFDYYDSDALGKPTGNDMKEGKLTLPALYLLNNKPEKENTELAKKIKSLEASDEEIRHVIDKAKECGGIEYARRAMNEYRNRAVELLPKSADQDVVDALTAYVDYVVEREK